MRTFVHSLLCDVQLSDVSFHSSTQLDLSTKVIDSAVINQYEVRVIEVEWGQALRILQLLAVIERRKLPASLLPKATSISQYKLRRHNKT